MSLLSERMEAVVDDCTWGRLGPPRSSEVAEWAAVRNRVGVRTALAATEEVPA